MAENLRHATFLPLVAARQRAHHRPMTIYVLGMLLVAIATLAPRYGADSRDRCARPCR
jgi:hypothetical protein